MGDDNQGMFAGEIGVDQKRAESVGGCLSPGDARLSLVHLQGVRDWPQKKEQDTQREKAQLLPHGIKLTQ